VSVGSAFVAQASGVLQSFAGNIEKAEINIQTASVSLILTAEDREKATDIVLMDSQIQALLENADNYTLTVSEVFDIHEISFDVHEIVVVTVSGKVSLLREVWGYLFMLDETVTVFYRHEEANVDVSNIENGDTVTVIGKFSSPDTIYALEIEKN